jgi:hypothetical protein
MKGLALADGAASIDGREKRRIFHRRKEDRNEKMIGFHDSLFASAHYTTEIYSRVRRRKRMSHAMTFVKKSEKRGAKNAAPGERARSLHLLTLPAVRIMD